MKSNLFFGFIIVLVVLSGAIVIMNNSSTLVAAQLSTSTTTLANVGTGEVQVVRMYVEGGTYVFEPSSVTKDIPVRLEADMSRMPGCSRSVMSSGLGIRKSFSTKDNTLEFTPTKAGTFYIACSMNMYKGTLTVLESDGTPSAYKEAAPAGGHTCGSSGGGCGCGG